jgi:hypothetical protein
MLGAFSYLNRKYFHDFYLNLSTPRPRPFVQIYSCFVLSFILFLNDSILRANYILLTLNYHAMASSANNLVFFSCARVSGDANANIYPLQEELGIAK